MFDKVLSEGRSVLDEKEARDFLSAYCIPSIATQTIRTLEEALVTADLVGYPVAIKIVSPQIRYKKDVGGVMTGIASAAQLRGAYAEMMREVERRAPGIPIERITLQKMVDVVDYKLILGSKRDKEFGSVIYFGLGGENADLIRDFAMGLAPLNRTLARRLIEETKAYRLIQGYRGKTPADIETLEEVLVNFSNLIVDFPEISEIDINPLVLSQGMPYARDVRIALETQSIEDWLIINYQSQYPHLVIAPYPLRLVTHWKLTDGTDVVLRPIKPEDEPLVRDFLSSLPEDTLRTRFFFSVSITHEWLVLMCDTDYDRQLAIVAEITEGDRRKIVSVGSLHVDSERNIGEFALLVHDDFQRKGLASKLMQLIISHGREKGLREIEGQILSDNEKMLGLSRKLGFTKKWQHGSTTCVCLHLK